MISSILLHNTYSYILKVVFLIKHFKTQLHVLYQNTVSTMAVT